LLAENRYRLVRITVGDFGGAVQGPPAPGALAGNANLHAVEIISGAEAIGQSADHTVAGAQRQRRIAKAFLDLQLFRQIQVTEADQEIQVAPAAATHRAPIIDFRSPERAIAGDVHAAGAARFVYVFGELAAVRRARIDDVEGAEQDA